jgi:hypothetical protein
MVTDITKNDLILLAYNELPENESLTLYKAMEANSELKAQFNLIKQEMARLDSYSESPSDTSVQIVIEESCSSSPMEMI